jgi:hypothetical protein
MSEFPTVHAGLAGTIDVAGDLTVASASAPCVSRVPASEVRPRTAMWRKRCCAAQSSSARTSSTHRRLVRPPHQRGAHQGGAPPVPRRFGDRNQRIYEPTQGPPPEGATPRQAMRQRLRTPEGVATYKRRGATVEPAIGNLKKIISGRSRRGLQAATAEVNLAAAAFNLLKIYRTAPAGG